MSPFCLLASPFRKRVYSKREEFAPSGSKVFLYRVDPFQKCSKNIFSTDLPPLKVYQIPLRMFNIWIVSLWLYQRKGRKINVKDIMGEWYGSCHAKTCPGICGQLRPWSACASAQADQGLNCLLTESLGAAACMNGEQRPRWYFAHAQDDLNMHILRALHNGANWQLSGARKKIRWG